MAIHSEDRQILIHGKDGVLFQASVTHVEKKGKHLVVLATADEHLPRLRDNAPGLLSLLTRQHGTSLDRLRYFERGRDGAIFEVNTRNVALSAALGNQASAQTVRRGVWRDEKMLMKRLGNVRLPQVNPTLSMTPAVNVKAEAPQQKVTKPAVRTQHPRYPRPQ